MNDAKFSSLSRRDFLATAAAAASAAAVPGSAQAQTSAKFRRRNISEPGFPPRVLESYKKAIRAMLALPPSDPRNWYRNALIHTLDCPHGNWWFVVWHRAYVGWFEQTCRDLSGDQDFALPYWDWTKEPRVPAAMFDDVLTPTNSAYIASFAEFKTYMQSAVADFWGKLSNDQFSALLVRCYRNPDDLWWDIENFPMFFDRDKARGLTAANPNFDADTQKLVSLPTVLNALAPIDFLTFGSAKTRFHSSLTGFGVLEGQPHNRVHNCVGGFYLTPQATGFMQDNLSPVDPLFFLHHGNIDRLWDVWTRKQEGLKLPTLPQGADLTAWSNEKFLFFIDSKGQPVTRTNAGAYAAIGDFSYDYQPGSGEEVVPVAVATAPLAAAPRTVQSFSAQLSNRAISSANPASASVKLPPALLEGGSGPRARRLFAKITLDLPPLGHERDFKVTVGNSAGAGTDAGTFSMFGNHIMHGPVTFTVPLSTPAADPRAKKSLSAGGPLTIRVAPQGGPMQHASRMAVHATAPAEVVSVVVEAH